MRRIVAWGLAVLLCRPVLPVQAAVSVSARSAVLYEPTSGAVLFEKDAYTPRPMASTTKLMTALLAAEAADWERAVTVNAAAVAVEGSSLGLCAGDVLTLRDMVSGMLLTSGNDAANAVAVALAGSEEAFVEQMNRKAAELGMIATHFATASGLDGEGHAASAYDMALLGAAVLRDETLATLCAAPHDTIDVSGHTRTVTNHNRLLSLYPAAVGLKTGFTKKAGRCLVSAATRDGVTLIAVTLNDGDDWNDHMALFEYGFSQVRAVELPAPSPLPLPVTGGVADEVTLTVSAVPRPVVPAGETVTVDMTVMLPPFVFAPIAAGETVGAVHYTRNGEEWFSLPVIAGEAVAAREVPTTGGHFYETWRLLLAGLLTG